MLPQTWLPQAGSQIKNTRIEICESAALYTGTSLHIFMRISGSHRYPNVQSGLIKWQV